MSDWRRSTRLWQLGLGGTAVIALAVTAVAVSSRGSRTGAPRETTADGSRELRLIVSGDTQGWIVPCGCTSNQSGGMLRRGTFVSEQPEEADVVYLDAGGAPGGAARYDLLKFEAILRGETALGLVAHNIGGAEIDLGVDALRDLAFRENVPFVSTNVTDSGGKPVAEPFRIVDAGGRRLLIAGVLSPEYATRGVRIDNPRDSLLALLERLESGFDEFIVLAYLPESELRALASELPEADVIIGGPTGQSIPPVQVGPTLLASATNKGKFLAELVAPSESESGWQGRVVEITGEFADDSEQAANLSLFRDRLAELDIAASETAFAPRSPDAAPPGFAVAGSEACRDCHADDYALWEESAHAHAWQTLETDRAYVDSYCQQCHTTGFGQPDGFASVRRTPHRVDVGCESCHGPSQAHVDDPAVRTPYSAASQCIDCHDRENSPKFQYQTYWARIVHGQTD